VPNISPLLRNSTVRPSGCVGLFFLGTPAKTSARLVDYRVGIDARVSLVLARPSYSPQGEPTAERGRLQGERLARRALRDGVRGKRNRGCRTRRVLSRYSRTFLIK
jgi:hypothetical protein